MDQGPCVVYAHNGGRFDFLFLLEFIKNYTPLQIINGRLAKFKIGDVEFRDSYSLLPIPLKAYKKDEFDYRMLELKARKRHMPKIIQYLKGDCVYLWELVEDFLVNEGVSLTIGTASLKKMCKIKEIESPKSTHAYFNKFKEYYFGGRVESFAKGKKKGPIRNWDINSAYPFAMLDNHPWECEYQRFSTAPKQAQGHSFLTLTAKSTGAFPFHALKGGTCFPDDGEMREFKVTGWEYLAAKELGLLKNAKVSAYYIHGKTLDFKDFVNPIFEQRRKEKAGSAEKLRLKLFLNNCYGKFGQNGAKFEQFQIAPLSAIHKLASQGWHLREPLPDGRAVFARPEDREKWRFFNVATAASITGWVRAYLLRYMKKAIKAGSVIYYCDTDCLDVFGPWEPPQGDELGKWKLETVFKSKYYAGKKLYAGQDYKGKWHTASKGAKLTGPQIAKVAMGGVVKYQRDAPTFSILSETRFVTRNIKSTHKKPA